ncbi:Hypothetical protein FKW44_021388 [Caligus rogercresseyi]|uniref:Uncharacterized protein n=1 Tax=Caligus rogercresseyi TaxID=217165 RepID=A0A7T8JWD9_CALRO|nr:Hypothetical protein FKW44_021388 [Caligus rogercresseyi]
MELEMVGRIQLSYRSKEDPRRGVAPRSSKTQSIPKTRDHKCSTFKWNQKDKNAKMRGGSATIEERWVSSLSIERNRSHRLQLFLSASLVMRAT